MLQDRHHSFKETLFRWTHVSSNMKRLLMTSALVSAALLQTIPAHAHWQSVVGYTYEHYNKVNVSSMHYPTLACTGITLNENGVPAINLRLFYTPIIKNVSEDLAFNGPIFNLQYRTNGSSTWQSVSPSTSFVVDDLPPSGMTREQYFSLKYPHASLPPIDDEHGDWIHYADISITDFNWDTEYIYRVTLVKDADVKDPIVVDDSIPCDADTYEQNVAENLQFTLRFIPKKSIVYQNQTVDSRIDPRETEPTFLDYIFWSKPNAQDSDLESKALVYNGGLFAGYADDPSKIGRSYLKFELPPYPDSAKIYAASLNAYYVKSLTVNTPMSVKCEPVPDTWDPKTLQWTLSQDLSPYSLTYDAPVISGISDTSTTGNPRWYSWNIPWIVENEWKRDSMLSLRLTSTNEGTAAWAYFAKKEYDATKAAQLLYIRNGLPFDCN